ncbi:hypothetical protein DL766_006952 [Monosporascus sp. MC13-8B]|nr:hypothetical protein DL766_006952 [Monosporascus sp. MC13-8B]
MRLLKRDDTGAISLTEDIIGDRIPRYAILSHRWGMEEVTFKDLMDGTGPSRQGYDKIRFCSDQAERDGLDHFWVDTCCIDKSSSAELTEAINSMFQWYRNAAKCYVYLDDVSKPALQTGDEPNYQPWEPDLRRSKWFTRGWTLQELLAPASVEFFSREGARLGTKRSLELPISEITGIPLKVLRGSPLLDCSVPERMAWAESRQTTRDEDKAYSLLGIFDVQMPLIYGEGKEKAFKRLQEEIDKARKGKLALSILTIIKSLTYPGIQHEDFSVTFSLSGVPEIEHFVAREQELAEMRETLNSDGSRRVVVLHGLGGIGKTQLAIAYAKRHKGSYSAMFWLNIKDENSLKQSFSMMLKRILRKHPSASHLSSVDTENLDEVIDAVKAWLSLPSNTRWLLIYDNYDNPKLPSNKDPAALDIDNFLPESYQGSVIITTRSSQVTIGHPIRIRKMENVLDSIEILSNASNRRELIHSNLYYNQGKLKEAEEMYQRALQGYEKALGPDHTSTLDTVNNLGLLYSDQGKLKEAKEMYQRALQGYEKTLGPDYTSTLDIVNNLGVLYSDQSKLKEAEKMYQRALGLGLLYKNQGKLKKAEKMYKRVLQGYEKTLGPDHTSILDTVNNLGLLYFDQGKLKEAKEIYQRALQGYEKALSPDYTLTLDIINNLGVLYSD